MSAAEQASAQSECSSCACLERPCWRHDPLLADPSLRRAAALGSIRGRAKWALALLNAGDVDGCRQELEEVLADYRVVDEEDDSRG